MRKPNKPIYNFFNIINVFDTEPIDANAFDKNKETDNYKKAIAFEQQMLIENLDLRIRNNKIIMDVVDGLISDNYLKLKDFELEQIKNYCDNSDLEKLDRVNEKEKLLEKMRVYLPEDIKEKINRAIIGKMSIMMTKRIIEYNDNEFYIFDVDGSRSKELNKLSEASVVELSDTVRHLFNTDELSRKGNADDANLCISELKYTNCNSIYRMLSDFRKTQTLLDGTFLYEHETLSYDNKGKLIVDSEERDVIHTENVRVIAHKDIGIEINDRKVTDEHGILIPDEKLGSIVDEYGRNKVILNNVKEFDNLTQQIISLYTNQKKGINEKLSNCQIQRKERYDEHTLKYRVHPPLFFKLVETEVGDENNKIKDIAENGIVCKDGKFLALSNKASMLEHSGDGCVGVICAPKNVNTDSLFSEFSVDRIGEESIVGFVKKNQEGKLVFVENYNRYTFSELPYTTSPFRDNEVLDNNWVEKLESFNSKNISELADKHKNRMIKILDCLREGEGGGQFSKINEE